MSTISSKLPDWQVRYQVALREIDSTRIIQRVDDAAEAIARRLQESDNTLTEEETRAIHTAIRGLRILRDGRLAA